jgi:ankyrin repeat protein
MRACALAVVFAATPSLAEPWASVDAIIWTSEKTAEAADAQLAKATPALKAAGLTLAAGWPRVIDSGDISGLKPGFKVTLIGFCPEADTTRVLMRAKSAQRLSYVRQVQLNEAQQKDARCPGIDAAIKPPPAPAFLVVVTGKNKAALEARLERLPKSEGVQLPEGYPKVVETKTLKVAAPPGKTAERFLLVVGVCEVVQAEVVLAALDSYGAWPAWALDDPPMACPTVTDAGLRKALAKAIALEEPELVKAFAARVTGAEARADGLRTAVHDSRPAMLRVLLAAWGTAALPTDALDGAFDLWPSPEVFERRRLVVQQLLDAGLKPSPVALQRAVERCDPGSVRLLFDKGAKPDPARDLLESALNCPASLLSLLVEKRLVTFGRPTDARALVYAAPELREVMLKSGASLDAKAPGGLSVLDLVFLFPEENDVVRAQLEKARPALAASLAGKGAETVSGWSPLLVASAVGNADAVKALLDKGAKADEAVALPDSPFTRFDALALAMDAKAEAAAVTLVERGASVSATSGLCCSVRGDWKLPDDMVRFRAEGLAIGTYDRFRRERVATEPPGHAWAPTGSSQLALKPVSVTPLGRAALHGQLTVAQRLLEKGAPLEDGVASLGLTPLHLAAQQGRFEVFDLLLQKGAKVDAVDAVGRNVLFHLISGGADAERVTKVLAKKKALAQSKGLLTHAVLTSTLEVVLVLLDGGAGKKGEGKAAADALCSRGDGEREAIFFELETAGFRTGRAFFGDCIQQGD